MVTTISAHHGIRAHVPILLLTMALFTLGCSDDKACPTGCPSEACEADGNCASDPCTAAGQCQDGLYCDTEIGWCRFGCESDRLCDDGRVCDPASHRCTDCSASLACLPDTGTCQAGVCVGCESDSDCGLGQGMFCQQTQRQCVEGCLVSENCPTSLVCDTEARRCVECREDADCGMGTCNTTSGTCE